MYNPELIPKKYLNLVVTSFCSKYIWNSYEECNINHDYGISTWVGVTLFYSKYIWNSCEECNIKHDYGINTWGGVTYVHPKVQSRNKTQYRVYSEKWGLEKRVKNSDNLISITYKVHMEIVKMLNILHLISK